jgi:hypothetical protein
VIAASGIAARLAGRPTDAGNVRKLTAAISKANADGIVIADVNNATGRSQEPTW